MASVTYRREEDSSFNAWSGIGSSWSYGSYSGGKTTGYYGRSSNGYAVALFKFTLPTSIPSSAVVTSIVFKVHGRPTVSSGTTTCARLAQTLPSPDTPQGWLNRSDYLAQSSTCTNGTTGTDVWNNYTFSSLSSANLKAGNVVYFYLYGTSSSSLVDYNITLWSPYMDITYETISTYAPTSVTRTTFGYGLYSGAQYFQGKSSYSGRWLVGTNPTGPYYVRSESTANSTSCNFKVDQDTSTSQYYKLYYCTVIPNQTTTYSGTANYLTFVAPSYTWQVHLCSTGVFEMTSADKYKSNDYTLGSQDPPISGYTFVGYASSANTTSVDQTASSTWVATYNNKVRWCVFKKSASSKSITLYNCSSSSVATAKSTTAEAWLYGESPTPSGGGTTYTNGSYSPSAPSGYTSFQGWATSSGSYTDVYSNPQSAFEAGYTGSLYALWNGTTTTTCSLNGNGYSIASSSAWKQVTKRKYGYGSVTTMSTQYSTNHSYQPINSSATFIEWNTNSNGGGTGYDTPMDALDAGYTGTLYAIWEPEWTVKINNGTNWGDYHVWIYTGATSNNGWQQAIPYMYDGSNWKLTKI